MKIIIKNKIMNQMFKNIDIIIKSKKEKTKIIKAIKIHLMDKYKMVNQINIIKKKMMKNSHKNIKKSLKIIGQAKPQDKELLIK